MFSFASLPILSLVPNVGIGICLCTGVQFVIPPLCTPNVVIGIAFVLSAIFHTSTFNESLSFKEQYVPKHHQTSPLGLDAFDKLWISKPSYFFSSK